jgi:octaheme c-type cytochrome (tetrathionate reductase family)
MDALRHGKYRLAALLAFAWIALGAAGCGGDDGNDGIDGVPGTAGVDGADGQNCWDLNGNGVGDLPDEDLNGDGVVDVLDCNPAANEPAAGAVETFHRDYFAEKPYQGTDDCLNCHGPIGEDIITTGHWNWQGVALGIDGLEGEIHGKNDIINNFCVAVPTNEGRCTQCHIGYGYADKSFDFSDPSNVDCLVCHDQTATYAKAPKTAGNPEADVDLQAVAQSVAMNGGRPTREGCIDCHANAGGGDNVKHGDLALSIANTTRDYDVHMGTDGGNLDCVACHEVARDSGGNLVSHGIGGMAYHSNLEGKMKGCTDCHGSATVVHAGTSVESIVNSHTTLACQVCHIPTFARETPTKVYWDWSTAGQDIDPIPPDPDTGLPTYDKMKGSFDWSYNVRPTLRYQERTPEGYGKWEKVIMNVTDTFTEIPVVLAAPAGDYTTPGAMIYPFKEMPGKQVADANNNTVLVPHLFGLKGGDNPYWAKYDWDLALQDGAAYTGQTYSGDYTFVETVMYLSVNHEVAPKEEAYGYGGVSTGACFDCHTEDKIDWTALGWSADPFAGGTRP